ncbi:uncharacterized protein HD556DRAFT_1529798 [Suillus plorans]|uniref:Alpha-1,3-glucan synthase n=1 Tax=Suillus plorans TaxID=116603 RepID=A0A9P7AHD2_9AGAM|nr:uncharacterized protein HD556DRAFT_1529798 [Suillus plorans]KAG1788870.1 hypothetical protein HD556DRAFT_1529798 [Suillus plorans]
MALNSYSLDWTYFVEFPGSNGTATELGLWSHITRRYAERTKLDRGAHRCRDSRLSMPDMRPSYPFNSLSVSAHILRTSHSRSRARALRTRLTRTSHMHARPSRARSIGLRAPTDSSPSSFKRAPAYACTLRISRSRAHLARLRIAYARLRARYFPASTSARLVDIVSLHLIREELLSVAVLWVELYSRIQSRFLTFTDQVWLLYSNQNSSQAVSYDCSDPLWISSPYVGGTRIKVMRGEPNTTIVELMLEFNVNLSCDSVTQSLSFNMSSSGIGGQPMLNLTLVIYNAVTNSTMSSVARTPYSQWSWSGTLTDVLDGILEIIVNNPTSFDGTLSTGSIDHLVLCKGKGNNVMVFPKSDYDNTDFNYTDGQYTFTHRTYGADMFRYLGDFTPSWSNWTSWENVMTIPADVLSNSDTFWTGQHLIVQYWSGVATTSSVVVHADLNYNQQCRVPQLLARGPLNNWGYDQGISNAMNLVSDGTWELKIMAAWPTYLQLNMFGYDDYYYGDVDGGGVMDRIPPNSIALNYLNLLAPPYPALAWALIVDDATLEWTLEPHGHASVSATLYGLLCSLSLITRVLAVVIFMYSFYGIHHNLYGVQTNSGASKCFPIIGLLNKSAADFKESVTPIVEKIFGHKPNAEIVGWPEDKNKRRRVLIATLEYEIIDWKLKVKIGGLGVMSSLMGKAMMDVDLIWVIPKVKDLDYPAGELAEPIEAIVFNEPYHIEVEMHVWTISPMSSSTALFFFHAQTTSDPYPARMDDLSSAIFYSTWNQAIATTIRQFPVIDIYHINDYHGALAPIYLLLKVVPICLSLHNAEFQGLWPLRTKEEMKEVCSAFNISKEHCTKYVQFGNTFNLLHAAASFISVYQNSISVAGVSDNMSILPNPDPTDIAALDENPVAICEVQIDQVVEVQRPEMKRQAQEWANIKQDPNSDLFVFVGRWSRQKGVDLIADVMPSLLEKCPSIQLICVGPVIDLYGRFAVEKLVWLMEMYPDGVYSKLEFTVLPPYLFSGAGFSLIPSRDEPFGLVAVEFGRKGALGVGSRLGGLGLMPVTVTSKNPYTHFPFTSKRAVRTTLISYHAYLLS